VKSKPLIPRQRANQDVDAALDYFLAEGANPAARGFIDSLEQAYVHISRHPASGAIHYAHELNLPGLRFWPLKRYPYLVFYVEHATHIDIWRVLHGKRDIPAWLQNNNTL
jgi:toxin ParE1/3/4